MSKFLQLWLSDHSRFYAPRGSMKPSEPTTPKPSTTPSTPTETSNPATPPSSGVNISITLPIVGPIKISIG